MRRPGNRWLARAAVTLAMLAAALEAQTPASLAGAYHDHPTPARRAALLNYARAHPKDENGALARLALGVVAYEQKDYAGAASSLKGVEARLPKLADYAAGYRAAAEVESEASADVAADVAKVWAAPVESPLASLATLEGAKALTAAGKPGEAIRILSEQYGRLAQPDGDLALGASCEAAGEGARAAGYYQHVYYGYPSTDAAQKAGAALAGLRERMGTAYPPPTAQLMLARADRRLEIRDYAGARAEYRSLETELGGVERDQARVRVGAADYLRGEVSAAHQYLNSFQAGESEADAERLYYVVECARRLGDDGEMMEAVRHLNRRHAGSAWRFKALMSAANRYLLVNRVEDYEPLYEAAGKSFPAEARAPAAHWKYCWAGYMRRKHDAAERMREQLRLYPSHATAAAALYFLGRLAEEARDYAAARAWYGKLADGYPNYYYGILGRRRLAEPKVVSAPPSPKTAEFLRTIRFPENPYAGKLPAGPDTTLRIERARLLRRAGLADLADGELRFGARNGGQAVLLAVELAKAANSSYLALRAMKSLAPDNLAMPFDAAPEGFWRLLFPLPYQSDVMRTAKAQNLDPYMVAALIRQESEFNPQALSRAKAYGLTQVRPATGRTLARKAGMRGFSTRMLFQPATNLRLGTIYLRMLLDGYGGSWEDTLAAYNAGKSRVTEWRSWAEYREPAEFVETIPFTETREYVEAVLRNAELYRRVWGGG